MDKKSENVFRLKRATFVVCIGIGFLLAPFFNLAIPLKMGGHRSWYSPLAWIDLFIHLPVIEQVLLGAILAAGILLFFQRKSSWFGAVVILMAVSTYNIFFSENPLSGNAWGSFNLFVNASILVVFYFFRFPYLDQRDHIMTGYAQRYQSEIEVSINGKFEGIVKNISETGCFVVFKGETPDLTLGKKLDVGFTKVLSIKCIISHANGGVGLKFLDMTPAKKKYIGGVINSIKQS